MSRRNRTNVCMATCGGSAVSRRLVGMGIPSVLTIRRKASIFQMDTSTDTAAHWVLHRVVGPHRPVWCKAVRVKGHPERAVREWSVPRMNWGMQRPGAKCQTSSL